jgi:hypothetical protein
MIVEKLQSWNAQHSCQDSIGRAYVFLDCLLAFHTYYKDTFELIKLELEGLLVRVVQ